MGGEFGPGTEDFRSVKNKINQEGWQRDDDGDGEAAVFIGTKQEAEAARKNLDSKEVTFADLRSYLADNSVQLADSAEMVKALLKTSSMYRWEIIKPGSCIHRPLTDTETRLVFKSKDGSLKECIIDKRRISEDFGDLDEDENNVLEKLGFSWDRSLLSMKATLLEYRRQRSLEEAANKEFEF